MKKILFLHGLESKGVKKVRFLTTLGLVHAPTLNYEEDPKQLFNKTLKMAKRFKPDLIVGSSMGGYFAHKLATHIRTEVVLFNPATINEWTYYDNMDIETTTGTKRLKGTVIIGSKDEIIDPIKSYEYYDKLDADLHIQQVEVLGHRTPSEIFELYMGLVLQIFEK
jgi:predicted esterase YcpF (UPF0227 family)